MEIGAARFRTAVWKTLEGFSIFTHRGRGIDDQLVAGNLGRYESDYNETIDDDI